MLSISRKISAFRNAHPRAAKVLQHAAVATSMSSIRLGLYRRYLHILPTPETEQLIEHGFLVPTEYTRAVIDKFMPKKLQAMLDKLIPSTHLDKELPKKAKQSFMLSAGTAAFCLRTGIPYQNPDLFVSHYLPNARKWAKDAFNKLRGKHS